MPDKHKKHTPIVSEKQEELDDLEDRLLYQNSKDEVGNPVPWEKLKGEISNGKERRYGE